MAKSQNGWAAHESSNQMIPLLWITGRVHPDTVAIFNHLCRRFQAEVEPIIREHSWGYNYRPIRGRVNLSNHASGTAIDLNAPTHPLGKANTFTAPQRAAIRRILNDFQGAITWGGDWTARPDDMHFEVANGVSAATLRRITDALDNPAPKPDPATPVAPTPTSEEDNEMIIFYAGGYPNGVLMAGGGITVLRTEAEVNNLKAAGAKVVWVEKLTLDELIGSARGKYDSVSVRNG